jgi:hypothetical protein
MRHSPGHASDRTGDSAVGEVAGESLLVEVFSRIEDERDRVLLLAHIGLDISLRNLARVMGTTRIDLEERVANIVAKLREDAELLDMLGDIHRAGANDRYQAMVFRLGLEDWFCSYCGQFMLQSELGVKRKTCSDRCRYKLYKARGIGWKNQRETLSPKISMTGSASVPRTSTESINREKLATLLRPIEAGERRTASRGSSNTFWWKPDTKCRDRAMLLLGFTCPVPLSPSDLARLNIDDVSQHPVGLEVRLFKGYGTRYVIVPAGADSKLCPVTALSAWRTRLVRTGRTTGRLFIRMDSEGNLPARNAYPDLGLSGQNITQVIINTASHGWPKVSHEGLKPSKLLSDFLDEISGPTH